MKSKMSKLKRVESVLLFLILLFLPTQLGKHFWPQFAYIYSLKIDYLSPAIYFWDFLVAGLVIVWLVGRPAINRLALNLFLLFLFTQIVSLPGALNIEAGLVRLEQYLLAGLFGVFLASQDMKNLSKKIYLPFVIGLLGEAALAILQFIKGGTLGLWILGERTFNLSTPGIAKFDFYGHQFLRPYGTFPHPNVLAGFIILSIVILRRLVPILSGSRSIGAEGSNYILLRQSRIRMTVLDFISLFAGLTIFLTMSRTVILAGVITLLLTVKRRWFVWIMLILLVMSPILFTRFSSLFSFDNLTLLRREEQISTAWQIFQNRPIFGVGLNNFIPTIATDLTVGPSRFLQPVHNIFLLALSETGLVGLSGLIILIGFPILKIIKLNPFRFTLYPVLPWLIILFLGMFDHYFLTLPQGYRMLFLVWGLSLAMLK